MHLNLTALGDGSVGGGLGAHATYGHTAAADQDAAKDRKYHEDNHAEDDDDKQAGGQARSVEIFAVPKVAVGTIIGPERTRIAFASSRAARVTVGGAGRGKLWAVATWNRVRRGGGCPGAGGAIDGVSR